MAHKCKQSFPSKKETLNTEEIKKYIYNKHEHWV